MKFRVVDPPYGYLGDDLEEALEWDYDDSMNDPDCCDGKWARFHKMLIECYDTNDRDNRGQWIQLIYVAPMKREWKQPIQDVINARLAEKDAKFSVVIGINKDDDIGYYLDHSEYTGEKDNDLLDI